MIKIIARAPQLLQSVFYLQGVSTRKVKAVTEDLCGHSFSASAISTISKGLDETLDRFAQRHLDEAYPYLILDARYERVREAGVIAHQAVLIAIGINWDGQHLKSTNMLERLNGEIKRRTRVVRIFPHIESCLRLVRALCVETHETWPEDNRYLNMMLLAEQKKEALRLAA